MISPSNRVLAIELIQEANRNGARLAKACQELHISVRTYERWISDGGVKVDQRPLTKRPTPKNKLSQEEKEEILTIVKQEEYANCPPTPPTPQVESKPEEQRTVVYVVQKGDCLIKIAKKYNVHYLDIAKENNIKNPNWIYPNQKLTITLPQ